MNVAGAEAKPCYTPMEPAVPVGNLPERVWACSAFLVHWRKRSRETGRQLGLKNTCLRDQDLIGLERRLGSLKGDAEKSTVGGISRSRDRAAGLGKQISGAENPTSRTLREHHDPGEP